MRACFIKTILVKSFLHTLLVISSALLNINIYQASWWINKSNNSFVEYIQLVTVNIALKVPELKTPIEILKYFFSFPYNNDLRPNMKKTICKGYAIYWVWPPVAHWPCVSPIKKGLRGKLYQQSQCCASPGSLPCPT